MLKEKFKFLECPFRKEEILRIVFTEMRDEEWTVNGDNWECTFNHSLSDSPERNVKCSECNEVIGTGIEFGF